MNTFKTDFSIQTVQFDLTVELNAMPPFYYAVNPGVPVPADVVHNHRITCASEPKYREVAFAAPGELAKVLHRVMENAAAHAPAMMGDEEALLYFGLR